MAGENQTSEETKKQEYVLYWSKVLEQGKQKKELGTQLQKEGSFEIDLASAHLRALDIGIMLPNTDWERHIYDAQLISGIQATQIGIITETASPGTIAYTSGSTTALMDQFSSSNIQNLPSPDLQKRATTFQTDLYQMFERSDRKSEVLEEMRRVGLDHSTRGKEAIEQFKSAWELHEQSPPTPTASFIPMREAILFTIGELVRLRPTQRKAGKHKIVEIGRQVAKEGIAPTHFQRLQEEWDGEPEITKGLSNELSAYKHPVGDRQTEHNRLMMKATLFLIRLLSAVDSSKLRES